MKMDRWLLFLVSAVVLLTQTHASISLLSRRSATLSGIGQKWGLQDVSRRSTLSTRGGLSCASSSCWDVVESLRAGATEEEEDVDDIDDEEEETVGEEAEEEYADEDYDIYDSEDVDEEEYENDVDMDTAPEVDESQDVQTETDYDEPLQLSAPLQLGATMWVMLLCRRFDLYNPKVVRLARFAFIAYVIVVQIFLAYVRIKAKLNNDRTPITLTNPISSLVQSQLQQKGGEAGNADMVKGLASQFLSSQSTVMEYDLIQAKNVNSGLLTNMLFMWFLHFKMNKTQPLYINSAIGLLNLVYSPLFQVYIMGRNLQRPFKNPKMSALQKKMEAQKQAAMESDETDENIGETVDTAEDIAEDVTEDVATEEEIVEEIVEEDDYDADVDESEDDVDEDEEEE